MNLFDLHCDAAFRMDRERITPLSTKLHVNAKGVRAFGQVTQVFAFWCDKNEDDQSAYLSFFRMYRGLRRKIGLYGPHLTPYLSVEDGRLLCYETERLETLYRLGIRIFTPLWGDRNALGCAHNAASDTGLTAFGVAACLEAMRLGMICDLSHASLGSAEELLALSLSARRPVVASHSAFSAICPHTRNLTDRQALAVKERGGLIGLAAVPAFLAGEDASVADMVAHIKHGLSLGLSGCLCLGCDFDGTDTLPHGMTDISSILRLARMLSDGGLTDLEIDCLLWRSASEFFKKNIT